MTGAPWPRVKEILAEALEQPAAARREFVARACGGDDGLRREVESLLETHGCGEGFLESADIPAGIAAAIPRDGAPLAAGPARARICPLCSARFEDGTLFCPDDDEVLVEDPTALVGATLDGLYEIEAMLGQGGMGAVYRARHVVLGDRVAVKVIRGEMSVHPEWLRRFRREGQAARRFKHPNAVVVHDMRTSSDGTTYMVMEYVEGRTLRDELGRRGRLPVAEALDVLDAVASVLDAAHASGVVHRDLKPENVMLGASGVKVLDLGIAKLHEAGDATGLGASALTVPGQAIGTPFYMPPEQWGVLPSDGDPEVDGRADVYSLAVMAHETLCGRRPFEATTVQELRREHVTRAPARLDAVAPWIPERFADEVARALAKDRAERHATAGEFVAALRRAMGPDPAEHETLAFAATSPVAPARETAPIGARGIAALRPRRRRALWGAGAVAAAALLSAGLLYSPAPTPEPAAAPPPAPVSPTGPAVPAYRFAVEVEKPRAGQERVSEAPRVDAGQAFKLRLAFAEAGYVYVLAPHDGHPLVTLLTADPMPETAVRTNAVAAGQEVAFPGPDMWLGLRDDEAVTRYTVVFSRAPLAEPAFLAGRAGRRLSAAEQSEFEAFARGAAARGVAVFDVPVALDVGAAR